MAAKGPQMLAAFGVPKMNFLQRPAASEIFAIRRKSDRPERALAILGDHELLDGTVRQFVATNAGCKPANHQSRKDAPLHGIHHFQTASRSQQGKQFALDSKRADIYFVMQSKEGAAMELHDALTHIAEIRLRMAETELFRGYRAVPVAFSGAAAVAAALVQAAQVPEPMHDLPQYLLLWIATAAVSVLAVGLTMLARDQFGKTSTTRAAAWLALGQFAPCLLAGALVTLAVVRGAPEHAELLPGLWQVLFSLGVFASNRLMPRATFAIGLWYLLAGTISLVLARGQFALSPWAMGVPFGIGQLATAAILYWALERRHESTE